MKTHVKAGDEVVVIAGNPKGERGRILQVYPRKGRVLVEGVNKCKFHEKKKKEGEEGGIIEREAPVHISNVMRADVWEARRQRRPAGEETPS